MIESLPKNELERRAKARRLVDWCNSVVHRAPWIDGDATVSGGVFLALELAEKAHQVHSLPYEQGFSKLGLYDPRRFTWVYDGANERECVKVRDNQTGRVAAWPHAAAT